MSEIVKADRPDLRPGCRLTEPLAYAGWVEHAAAPGVAEDEVLAALEAGAFEVVAQCGCDAFGERDSPDGAARLGGAELAVGVGAADADEAGVPVDVLP